MSDEAEELKAFEQALRRYSTILGLRINVELAKSVEAVQAKIMKDVEAFLSSVDLGSPDLSNLLARLSDSGRLSNYIVEVGRALKDEVSPDKAEESLTKALEGDVSSRGSRSALLVFQAVARAYASHYERKNGTVEEVTAYCPLCGSESRTMVRVGEEYLMVCHLCGYAWRVSRKTLVCPFCGNSNPFSIGIFMDKDGRLGLAYCQECGSSWRVVLDERVASAPRILLPLLALAAERLRGALPGGASGEELHEGSSEGQLGGGNDEAQGQQ